MWTIFLLLTVLSTVLGDENEQIIFKYTFEDDNYSEWTDESRGGVTWVVDDGVNERTSVQLPPRPIDGRKYLRLRQSPDKSFAPAIFLTSYYETNRQKFERFFFSFDYWLNSEFPEHNNIEIFLNYKNGYKRLLNTKFYKDSLPNSEWRRYSVFIDASDLMIPERFAIAIFGFCGLSTNDGIALDNIILSSISMENNFTTSSTTTTNDATTTTTKTTTSTPRSPIGACSGGPIPCQNDAAKYGNYAVTGDPCINKHCTCLQNGTVFIQMCTPTGHVFNSEIGECEPCPQVKACQTFPNCGNNLQLFQL